VTHLQQRYQQKVSMSTHGSYSMRSKASFENEAKATVKESGVSREIEKSTKRD